MSLGRDDGCQNERTTNTQACEAHAGAVGNKKDGGVRQRWRAFRARPENQPLLYASTAAKHLFPLLIALLAMRRLPAAEFAISFLGAVLEVGAVLLLTMLIQRRSPKAAGALNSILLMLVNIQLVVLYFGSSFLSVIMFTNLRFVPALSGNMPAYVAGGVAVAAFSYLPIAQMRLPSRAARVCATAALATYLVSLPLGQAQNSPLCAYLTLTADGARLAADHAAVDSADNSKAAGARESRFSQQDINDCISKDPDLPEQPNVVLVFIEGLSQSVIDDPRGIMPHLAHLQDKSLCFQNYYNHTYATGRGIIGQLYSGYQLNDLDENGLTSLADVLEAEGYATSFINTEPQNEAFSNYLDGLGFQEVASSADTSGTQETLSDREAYELLFKRMQEANERGKPFFMSMYTFGTHMSMDSPDAVFGDGSNAELNKFRNADTQLGEFLQGLEESGMAKNTVVVLTADHCSYEDAAFRAAFPDYSRESEMCDRIPLVIYHAGVQAQKLDVDGRNSLGLAPTICDYLDVSAKNSFLGSSLFSGAEGGSPCERLFTDSVHLLSTADGSIEELEGADAKGFRSMLREYYRAARD